MSNHLLFLCVSSSLTTLYSICPNFEDIDLRNVNSTFQSNILQMFAVTKFALPHLKRGSAIINTTSVTAYKGSAGLGMSHMPIANGPLLIFVFIVVDYSSTKGAIVSFTRSLAMQLAPKGIRVNAVAPGPVITALQPASRPADNMEGLGVGMPLHGRAGQSAELGPSYVFLASSDSNLMTGQVLHVNSKWLNLVAFFSFRLFDLLFCRCSTHRCLIADRRDPCYNCTTVFEEYKHGNIQDC